MVHVSIVGVEQNALFGKAQIVGFRIFILYKYIGFREEKQQQRLVKKTVFLLTMSVVGT